MIDLSIKPNDDNWNHERQQGDSTSEDQFHDTDSKHIARFLPDLDPVTGMDASNYPDGLIQLSRSFLEVIHFPGGHTQQ